MGEDSHLMRIINATRFYSWRGSVEKTSGWHASVSRFTRTAIPHSPNLKRRAPPRTSNMINGYIRPTEQLVGRATN
eukprot:8084266-Pyramimonas_sp.AAC.1